MALAKYAEEISENYYERMTMREYLPQQKDLPSKNEVNGYNPYSLKVKTVGSYLVDSVH